jgi:hypothetical protein
MMMMMMMMIYRRRLFGWSYYLIAVYVCGKHESLRILYEGLFLVWKINNVADIRACGVVLSYSLYYKELK